jgi:hypothetical protein
MAPAGPAAGGDEAAIKAVVKKMVTSMMNGNKAEFVSCFDANAQQAKFLGIMPGLVGGMTELQKAVTAKFGKDAWQQFQGNAQMTTPFQSAEDIETALNKSKVTVTGNRATIEMEAAEGDPLNLVKKAGAWKIDPAPMMGGAPPPDQMDAAVKMMDAMAGAFKKAAAEAKKDGSTVDSVKAVLQQEMMKLMGQVMDEPQ